MRVREKVSVKLTGGIRRGGIAIEAEPITLRRSGADWEGSKTILLEPPVITAVTVVKGGPLAAYDFAVTINGVTQHLKGHVRGGVEPDEEHWPFAAFGLDEE